MNGIKAITTSITETATWAEALVITAGWAILFGILSILGLVAGAQPSAAIHYFCGTMSCAIASAILVSVIHGVLIAHRHIVAFERFSAQRATRLKARRLKRETR